MKRYFTILPLVAALAMCSCDDDRLQAQLDRAEAVILEHPDSALTILRGTSASGSRQQNARRALLYSMALDKNYIDITSDSLVTVARDYYHNHGTARERFLSEFYYACYLRNCNDLPGALRLYSDCVELGIEAGDHYHLGVLYSQIANIYEEQFDYDNAILYDQLALEQYRLSNAVSAQGMICSGLGENLFALNRLDEAAAYYHKALAIFEELRDTANIDNTLCGLACNHLYNGHIDSAEMAIDRISAEYGFHEYITLADIYRRRDRLDKAREYLAKAKEYVYNPRSYANVLHYESRIEMQEGNYQEAAEHRIRCAQICDSLISVSLRHPAASVHRDHFQELYRRASDNADLLRQRFWLTTTLIVVIAGIVIYYIIYIMRKRRRSSQLRYLQSLRESNAISNRMSQQINMQTRQAQHMRKLICDSFAPIDRIATTYYERKDSKTAQAGIYRDVERLLDSYVRDPKVKEHLEYTVDIGRGGIMKSLREELPQLSEKEFDLLLYIYAGFSTSAIALFTDDKPNNVYLRKSRLKNKIAKSAAPSRKTFIENMI